MKTYRIQIDATVILVWEHRVDPDGQGIEQVVGEYPLGSRGIDAAEARVAELARCR